MISLNDASVKMHLKLFEDTIINLVRESAACKRWCITLVSVMLVFALKQHKSYDAPIAMVPIAILCLLDAYYVSLLQETRKVYDSFLQSLVKGDAAPRSLPSTGMAFVNRVGAVNVMRSIASFSVWPVYLLLTGAMVITFLLAAR